MSPEDDKGQFAVTGSDRQGDSRRRFQTVCLTVDGGDKWLTAELRKVQQSVITVINVGSSMACFSLLRRRLKRTKYRDKLKQLDVNGKVLPYASCLEATDVGALVLLSRN